MPNYLVKDVIYYCNITTARCTRLSQQSIDYYDFTFVLEGTLNYYANNQKYTLHKHDAILLKPNTLRARDAGTEAVRYVSFNFHIFEDAKLPFDEFLPKCITANMRKILSTYPSSHLSSLHYSREKCQIMLNYLLYELLDEITAQIQYPNEHVLNILNYVEDHIHEKLSLQEIACQINMSKEYVSYLFKKEMHQTLTDYIHERKLLIARDLILLGEMSLADVAAYMGFENYNYFCRLFKRRFEITPSQLVESKN